MAESFPSSIATSILTTIAMFKSPETRPLEETLSNIQDVLLIAEEQQAQDLELQFLLAKISDVLYDAEDMIDKLRCGAAKPSGIKVSNFLACIFPTLSKIQKIRKAIGRTASAIQDRCDQNRRRRVNSGDTVIDHNFGSTSQVLGRDYHKEEIFKFLTKGTKTVSVLQIVGSEGIGKTTLARLVYNDKMIDEHFELKLWVRAPADFEITSLLREIYIAATGKNDDAKLTLEQLFDFCSQTLKPKFLLVLDNLLNEDEDKWEDIWRKLFDGRENGGKIVVTAPSNWASEITGTVDTVVLNVLSNDHCVTLFEKLAFKDGGINRDPKLTEIGKEIVKICGGFPLAVKTLGSLLHQNTNPDDWELIRDDEIWGQDPEGAMKGFGDEIEQDIVISALKLSYAHLPSHLRRCLAYCSLFPKGYYFNSDYLLHSWMAQGFLATHDRNEEREDVGMRYLKILFSRCFFEDVEDNGCYFTFKMQGPIHDHVQKGEEGECKRINLGVSYPDISARHLLFTGSWNYNHQLPLISLNLRTMIMQLQSNDVGERFITKLTSKHKYLRLLCLSGLNFQALPDSIGELKHLRFLDLSWNSIIQELPEAICKLQSLQTLRLLGCSSLQNLPHKIQSLISLRYLEITTKDHDLPVEELPQGMQNLKSLQTIILQGCEELTSLPLWITSLSRLERLVIKNCPKLDLRMDSQGQGGNVRLNLKVFMIYDLQLLVDLPQLILQGSADTLKYMRIDTCPSLQELPPWLTSLASLEKLEIAGCPALSTLPNGMKNLTALRQLKIQKSPALSARCRDDMTSISHVKEIRLDPIVTP